MKIIVLIVFHLFAHSLVAGLPASSKMDVPYVKQDTVTMRNACGLASIEMIYKYWKLSGKEQKEIGVEVLERFSKAKRYVDCGILKTEPTNFRIYPGTGTSTMREFLKNYGAVDNFKMKQLPKDPKSALKVRGQMMAKLKSYIAKDIPVIVHQYTSRSNKAGHYRVVTGYDDVKKEVYLNDPRPKGGMITQSYKDFFYLWNVDKLWLHYNAIAFTPRSGSLIK